MPTNTEAKKLSLTVNLVGVQTYKGTTRPDRVLFDVPDGTVGELFVTHGQGVQWVKEHLGVEVVPEEGW